MKSQPGKQTQCTYYIAQYFKKRNQAIKFGQLIYNIIRHIFLEKLCTNGGGETIPRPFSKKSKLILSLDQQSKILRSFFIVCQVIDYQNILKLVDYLLLPHIIFKTKFLKLVSLPHFLHGF